MAFKGGNVEDVCRLCAVEAVNGIVIYSSEGMLLCLQEKILQCLQIEVSKDDIFPKKVCCPCRIRLEDSHLFAEQAKKVQQELELFVRRNSKKVIKVTNDIKMENKGVDCEYDELPLDVTIEFESEDLIQSGVGGAKKDNVCDEHEKSAKQNQRSEDEFENKSVWDDQNDVDVKEEALRDNEDVCNDDDNYELVEDDLELENDVTLKSEDNAARTPNEAQCSSSNNISTNSTDELFEDEEQNEEDEKLLDSNEHSEWKSQWGIKCNQCDQIFPFRSQFDKHYQASHHKKPFYTCSYCNKTMEKYSTFRSHCYRHVTEGRYRCEYCPKGFSLRSMLHVHILAKHTSEKPFVCEECGKRFVTRPGLNIHLKKHQTDKKIEYPCSDCGKILHTRGGLTNHQNVHKLGRQFMCDVCGKTFTQKVNMLQHVKQHNGERPFTCEKCGKCFAEKSHLNRHYSFHSENRPFQCTVCLKSYKTERCLKVHSMVHAEARPYVCTYCNKGFLSSSALKQHYNIHTGERPFACKFCDKTFTNYPNWLKHSRRRHKEDFQKGSISCVQRLKPVVSKPVELEHTQSNEQIQPHIQAISVRNKLEDGLMNESSRVSKTTQLDGQDLVSFNASSSSSSVGMLHNYLQQPYSEGQSHSTNPVASLHSVTLQSTQQTLRQLTLTQVYTDQVMVMSEPEPESILPV